MQVSQQWQWQWHTQRSPTSIEWRPGLTGKMQVSQQKLAKANTLWPDPPSKEEEFAHLLAESAHYLASIRIQNSYVLCVPMCALAPVLDMKTANLAGQHSIEVLVPLKKNLPHCSWVLISGGLDQNASQTLNLEQFVAEEAEHVPLWRRISQPRETLREQCARGPKGAQPRETLCVLHQSTNQVTKENRTSMRKHRFLWKFHLQTKGHQSFRLDERLIPKAEIDMSAIRSRFGRKHRKFFDTNVREKDGAVYFSKSSLRMIHTFSYVQSWEPRCVVGRVVKEAEIWMLSWRMRRTSRHEIIARSLWRARS